MDEIRENDVVALVTPRPEVGLKRGDVGNVIQVFDQTPEHPAGFIVEFVDKTGEVRAETDITDPSDIVKLRLNPRGTLEEWVGGSGLLAIVLTEVIGSTNLGRELGDRWLDLLHTHFTKARKITNKYDGHEIKVIGDSYTVAFRTAAAALDFVVAFNRNTGDERIKIRAGLHVGTARIIDDDILGIDDDILGIMVNYTELVERKESLKFWLVLSNEAKRYLELEKATRYWWLDFMPEEVRLPGAPESCQVWRVLPRLTQTPETLEGLED